MSAINSITLQQALAIGASIPSFFNGTQFEFVPTRAGQMCALDIWAVADDPGVTIRVLVGTAEVVETSEINGGGAATLSAQDDIVVTGIPCFGGDRLTVSVVNGSGAATAAKIRLVLNV